MTLVILLPFLLAIFDCLSLLLLLSFVLFLFVLPSFGPRRLLLRIPALVDQVDQFFHVVNVAQLGTFVIVLVLSQRLLPRVWLRLLVVSPLSSFWPVGVGLILVALFHSVVGLSQLEINLV